MRITNKLHFTENHRFYTYRDFSLSSLDSKMLYSVYQPMVGADAISLYMLFNQQISSDTSGFSPLEQQRRLFLSMGIDLNEKGRKSMTEHISKLEAIGLVQTFRKYLTDSEDYVYEYHLVQPLSPKEFFRNQHLILLLRDSIGKHMVFFIKEELAKDEPGEIREQQTHTEDISVPFYELFKLNTQVIDYELEQALAEVAPTRAIDVEHPPLKTVKYSEIIMRFPRDSINRMFVEQLKDKEDQMATINYVAKKYQLSLQKICRLLDEDEVFDEQGNLHIDRFQHKAHMNYSQDRKREEDRERNLHRVAIRTQDDHPEEKSVEMNYYLEMPTMFINQCNIHQYNMLLRNEPYTHVLKRFFPGVVPDHVSKIFEKIDLNYKLNEEVINVLIHYLKVNNLSWNKAFIDSIVSDMLGKQISNYEQAVDYIRNHNKVKDKAKNASVSFNGRVKTNQKPKIPIVQVTRQDKVTDEEYEEMLKLAREIEGD